MQAANASQAPGPELTLGIVATPGLPADMAPALAAELRTELSRAYPELTWRLPVVSDALVAAPALLPELIDAGRRKLLSEGWDMALCLTDLPLPSAGRTVAGHVSVSHSVVVISVPAIGVVAVRRRLREAALRLIGRALDGSGDRDASVGVRLRRLQDLADLGDDGFSPGWGSGRGGGRLMVGMLRPNRPWRLGVKLYRALIASLAVVAAALVTTDVWRIAVAVGWARLCNRRLRRAGDDRHPDSRPRPVGERRGRAVERPGRAVQHRHVTQPADRTADALRGAAPRHGPGRPTAGIDAAVPDGRRTPGRCRAVHRADLAGRVAGDGGWALGAGLEADSTVREAAYSYRPDVDPPAARRGPA